MPAFSRITKIVEVPDDVKVTMNGYQVSIKGPLGTLTRDFTHTKVQMQETDEGIQLDVYFPRKAEKAVIGTVEAHLKNMITGVRFGFENRLKIVFSHFPIRVNPDMKVKLVKIENLYGGRKPRFAKVLEGVTVEVDNDDVIVSGIDIEKVGQTAANIQELTRQHGKRRQSPKTFMDGVFIYHKGSKEPTA